MSDVEKYSVLTRDRVRDIVIVCTQARKDDCKLSLSMQNSDEEEKHFRLKATPSFSLFNGPQSLYVSLCACRKFNLDWIFSSRTANTTPWTSLLLHLNRWRESKRLNPGNVSLWRKIIVLEPPNRTLKLNGTNFEQVQVDFYSPVVKHEDAESERMSFWLFYALWMWNDVRAAILYILSNGFLKGTSIAYFSLWLLC